VSTQKRVMIYAAVMVTAVSMFLYSLENEGEKSANWPSFRGANAAGVAEGYAAPASWDLEKKANILWKTSIPGLGHSSPIVWGERIYVTTAVSDRKDPELKVGLYGNIQPVDENTVHRFKVYCLDKSSGKILWERTAHEGIPEVKRHPKSTHANPTPATDGRHLVVFFGSEGLFCYDMDGKLLWKKDFGVLESSFFVAPDAQWGFASSPVIHKDRVVVQVDVLKDSFLAALDIASGREIWRTPREDVPTWSTPTVHEGEGGIQVIVNGFKHIGAYDFETGREIWRLNGGGDIPVPTPVVSGGMVFVNGAHGRLSPIYAIKLDAKGDISLEPGTKSNDHVVWSISRGGAYMQTPLIYGGYLYNLRGNGSLTCFRAATGEQIYREQVGSMASFSSSGVAADGKLYFSSEQGDVYVVKAGPRFEVLAVNPMKDILMATPAIDKGVIYIRSHHYLTAVAAGR
jgi:outer membrane protein assembly factor BamB